MMKNSISKNFLSSTVKVTTRDIDVIASRLAIRQLLNYGWEVADLNNLVPFSSIYRVSSDIVERYAQKGPMRFLKDELKRKDPRILFFHSYKILNERLQLRMRYAEIPQNLAKLILKLSNIRNKYFPIDYLVLNSEGYLFVELKANNARLSKKQIEAVKTIQRAGYEVSILHVSLVVGLNAEIRLDTLLVQGL